MSGGELFKESSRCLFSNLSTANCLSDSEDNVSLHIVIFPNNSRGGRPVRATITLYPIGSYYYTVSLSTVVLNSRDRYEKLWLPEFLHF